MAAFAFTNPSEARAGGFGARGSYGQIGSSKMQRVGRRSAIVSHTHGRSPSPYNSRKGYFNPSIECYCRSRVKGDNDPDSNWKVYPCLSDATGTLSQAPDRPSFVKACFGQETLPKSGPQRTPGGRSNHRDSKQSGLYTVGASRRVARRLTSLVNTTINNDSTIRKNPSEVIDSVHISNSIDGTISMLVFGSRFQKRNLGPSNFGDHR